jgi:hypothetical protein
MFEKFFAVILDTFRSPLTPRYIGYRVYTSQTTHLNPPDILATVYTQVKLPPLIPPMYWGEKEIYLVPSPL